MGSPPIRPKDSGCHRRSARKMSAMVLACLLAFPPLPAWTAASAPAAGATALSGQYQAYAGRLRNSPFRRQLHVDSQESRDTVRGDLYAVIDHPFGRLGNLLEDPGNWCDVLILHINTKYCGVHAGTDDVTLQVNVGKKTPQPVEEAHALAFDYQVVARDRGYLEVRLDAPEGPMGTRMHRIVLRAMPLGEHRTFLRLTYGFAYGLAGRVALKTYLATVARDKVGFTANGRDDGGGPGYVGGLRGLVERNAMRYFLALDAWLDASSLPPGQRLMARLNGWYTATERYPRQLHEMEREEYLAMKQLEYARQRQRP